MTAPVYKTSAQAKSLCAVKQCPATCNLPTSMTEGAWKAMCKATMKREAELTISGKQKLTVSYCETCKGKRRPVGLRIIK